MSLSGGPSCVSDKRVRTHGHKVTAPPFNELHHPLKRGLYGRRRNWLRLSCGVTMGRYAFAELAR